MKQYSVTLVRDGQLVTSARVQLDASNKNLTKLCAEPFSSVFYYYLQPSSLRLYLVLKSSTSQPKTLTVTDDLTLGELAFKLGFKTGDFLQFQWLDPNHPIMITYKASEHHEKTYQIHAPKQLRIDHVVVYSMQKLLRPVLQGRETRTKFEIMFKNQNRFATIDPALCATTMAEQVKELRIVDERILTDLCHFTANVANWETTTLQDPKISLESFFLRLLCQCPFIVPPVCKPLQYGKALQPSLLLNQIDPLEPIYFLGEFCHVTIKTGTLEIHKPVPAEWSLAQMVEQLFFDHNGFYLRTFQGFEDHCVAMDETLLVGHVDWHRYFLNSAENFDLAFFEFEQYRFEMMVRDQESLYRIYNPQGWACRVRKEQDKQRERLVVTVEPGTELAFSKRLAFADSLYPRQAAEFAQAFELLLAEL